MFLLDAGKIKVHVCLAGRIDQNLTWPRRDFRKHSKSSKSADPIKTTKFRHMDQYGRRAPERAKMPFQNLSLLSSFQASRLALDPEVCTCSNLNTASYHALQLDLKFWQRFQHFSKELFVMSWAQKLRKHEKRTHLDQTRTKHGPNTSFQSCAHGILASATICSMIAMQKKGPQTTWRSWHQWLCWGILQRGTQNHPKMATWEIPVLMIVILYDILLWLCLLPDALKSSHCSTVSVWQGNVPRRSIVHAYSTLIGSGTSITRHCSSHGGPCFWGPWEIASLPGRRNSPLPWMLHNHRQKIQKAFSNPLLLGTPKRT